MIKEGHLVAGALINVATTVIISGDSTFYIDGEPKRFIGYHVLQAAAGRKTAVVAHLDTHVTLVFHTERETIAEAEEELTDEFEKLISRRFALTDGVSQ